MAMLVYQRVTFTDDFVVFFVQWQRFVQIFFCKQFLDVFWCSGCGLVKRFWMPGEQLVVLGDTVM